MSHLGEIRLMGHLLRYSIGLPYYRHASLSETPHHRGLPVVLKAHIWLAVSVTLVGENDSQESLLASYN